MIVVGEIIKTQGIKGEVKVKPITNDITRFKKIRTVYVGAVLYQISALRISGNFVFIRFACVDSCDKAAELVGKYIQVDRIHALLPSDNEFFIADLIDCDFVVDGKPCGKIKNVHQHGAADVFEVLLADGKIMMFPFLNKLELKINTENKTVEADSESLNQVAVIN